jgi:translation initiation factor 5B
MRAPICTILGNVDCGKTSLLDKLRHTNMQEKEAGGITQKIKVTHFKKNRIQDVTHDLKQTIDIPGIMFIDTPGHECFTNQRMCGVNISDIIVIVVDIFKGIEKQTVECIEMLKKTKTPFLVAANKLDKIYGWTNDNQEMSILKTSLKMQTKKVKNDVNDLLATLELNFAENGLNAKRYFDNKNMREYISIVPISAKNGDGLPDLLALINMLSSKYLKKKLCTSPTESGVTMGYFLENVKNMRSGELITSIVIHNTISVSDKIMYLNGRNKIHSSKIKYLYDDKNKVSKIDQSNDCHIKLNDKNNIMSGSPFYIFNDENEENVKNLLNVTMEKNDTEQSLDLKFDDDGIYVNVPTVGMGIAIYNLLKSKNHKIRGINIGEIKKVNVLKASMKNSTEKIKNNDVKTYLHRFSVILAYGTIVDKQIKEYAKMHKLEIISGDIIYHLVDRYTKLCKENDETIKNRYPNLLPKTLLTIFSQFIFTKRNPIIIGVKVKESKLMKDIIVETRSKKDDSVIVLGRIDGIHKNNENKNEADIGDDVCVKIVPLANCYKYEYGVDFDENSNIVTHYTATDRQMIKRFNWIFE